MFSPKYAALDRLKCYYFSLTDVESSSLDVPLLHNQTGPGERALPKSPTKATIQLLIMGDNAVP